MVVEPAGATRSTSADEGQQVGHTKPRKGPFDAKTLKSIKIALLDQRAELEDQLQIEEQAFRSNQSEVSGEVRADENPAEAGTATFEREKHLSIANNVQDLIDKSNKALEKIEEGSYGICESCGRPISLDRLKALPHALMCIECKKAEERR
jgi:DnaK suppressor protein